MVEPRARNPVFRASPFAEGKRHPGTVRTIDTDRPEPVTRRALSAEPAKTQVSADAAPADRKQGTLSEES